MALYKDADPDLGARLQAQLHDPARRKDREHRKLAENLNLAVRELEAKGIAWADLNLDDDAQFLPRFSYVVLEYREGRFQKPERFFWAVP